MKKLTILLLLSGITILGYGQAKEKQASVLESSHELKMNLFNAMAFKAIDVNYEYVLNENSSFGLGVFFKVDKAEVEKFGWLTFEVENNRSYSFTPYYRRYFSRGYSNGFFIEGFGMLNSGETVAIDYIDNQPEDMESESMFTELRTYDTYTHFALGISLGGKVTFKKGFLLEFYTGVGTGLNYGGGEGVTRGGLSLGYRF
ncbi:DUF3575 domain-containing protein [Aggregatimonas sangjinii]|uniref:DUF3575 domain-containing protein n=1 Tax=Aggregatimonas sangjinii TaxID=2583587 RepID=A0A5B7SW00_9FLAO|nr:DUF3575 domain-containing protein [Aggregatimonas sangjinii]QCX01208.1 DUF3575 domain-containing protein [Aggregatimonas sangjinii]